MAPKKTGKKASAKKGDAKKEKQEKKVKAKEESDEEKIELPPPAGDSDDDDEEEDDDQEDAIDEKVVEKAGKVAAKKTKANRLKEMEEKEEKEEKEERGVIYLGHLPTGFYEPQMKTFFRQFGKVTRLRLSRSKKNAGSKGYAFVEFEDESVARIVADTMNKYLLFEKQLVCHLVTKEKQHARLFKDWNRKRPNLQGSRRRKSASLHNDRPKVTVFGEEVPQATK